MGASEEAAHRQLESLARIRSEPSGLDTFARYLWQAKQAVRLWLYCLAETDSPLFVVCEQVEDLVLVYADRFRFLQLKTRDRGSWSAALMCDHGLDALCRSYRAAKEQGLHLRSSFELWLEGPVSDLPTTVEFVANPAQAAPAIRKKLLRQGMKASELDDFLGRLRIHHGQPSRSYIDTTVFYELGAIWPLSPPELGQIYERLLQAAEAAQSGVKPPGSIQRFLAAATKVDRDLPEVNEAFGLMRQQVLSYRQLIAVTPPLRQESDESLLARLADGENASRLELKLLRAGASRATIIQAKRLRIETEVRRQLHLAAADGAPEQLDDLARRLLSLAEATASRVLLNAVSNPALAARPADAISAELLSRPTELASCDKEDLFDGDAEKLFGLLCQLTDQCRFTWGVNQHAG